MDGHLMRWSLCVSPRPSCLPCQPHLCAHTVGMQESTPATRPLPAPPKLPHVEASGPSSRGRDPEEQSRMHKCPLSMGTGHQWVTETEGRQQRKSSPILFQNLKRAVVSTLRHPGSSSESSLSNCPSGTERSSAEKAQIVGFLYWAASQGAGLAQWPVLCLRLVSGEPGFRGR